MAYSAAKHFDTDPLIALTSVCVMLLPDFASLMESGERVTFAGIPVVAATYAYNVIPIILLVYCMSHIVKWLKKLIKESLAAVFSRRVRSFCYLASGHSRNRAYRQSVKRTAGGRA